MHNLFIGDRVFTSNLVHVKASGSREKVLMWCVWVNSHSNIEWVFKLILYWPINEIQQYRNIFLFSTTCWLCILRQFSKRDKSAWVWTRWGSTTLLGFTIIFKFPVQIHATKQKLPKMGTFGVTSTLYEDQDGMQGRKSRPFHKLGTGLVPKYITATCSSSALLIKFFKNIIMLIPPQYWLVLS